MAVIRRTLEVVRGQGKIIVAACTQSQSAYEDQALGHGLFTDALLRGLKGDASSGGEVTANSLFDFIDREIGSHRQRPMFFGHTTGRIVLMHFKDREVHSASIKKAIGGSTEPPKVRATWVILGRHYFPAQTVKANRDGTVALVVSPASGEDEANLSALRPGPYGGGATMPFAWNNDAASARVKEVESEMAGGRHVWTITLTPQEASSGGGFSEMSITTGGKRYSADDIAKLRAGRILLNDPPERPDEKYGYDADSFLEGSIRGSSDRCEVRVSPIRSVYVEHRQDPNWKHYARLQAVYALKASGTVDHILELDFGAVRSGGLTVKFRGRRDRLVSQKPTVIEISGVCPLT